MARGHTIRGGNNNTYSTVYVTIDVGMAYNDGEPNEWFASITPDEVPLSMTPSSEQPDRIVWVLDTPFNIQNGVRSIGPNKTWDWDDDDGKGGVVMGDGWDGENWPVPARGTGPDAKHYVLDITGYSQGAPSSAGPVQGHPYKYTINLKYGDTKIPIDPDIILGSL